MNSKIKARIEQLESVLMPGNSFVIVALADGTEKEVTVKEYLASEGRTMKFIKGSRLKPTKAGIKEAYRVLDCFISERRDYGIK